MKLPTDVEQIMVRKFQRYHQSWLKASVSDNESNASWPININLEVPTEKQALAQQEGVRSWITAWRTWESRYSKYDTGFLVWSERNWRFLGTQSVPERLIIIKPETAVFWVKKADEWAEVVTRFKTMVQQWPILPDVLAKHYRFLAGCNETDFLRLTDMIKWLCDNPNSNLYPRQIPVAGIDSKWLESHKGLVTELFAVIKKENDIDFFTVCGLKPLPQLLRMRILDPQLRNMTGGLCDISVPWEEAARLDIKPSCVFIVENLQSGLAFGDLPCSVVIMGLGYGVDSLSRLPWLYHARCFYWGDIDTHGFAILNRARKHILILDSILMDEATLLENRHLWVKEENPFASDNLPQLTNNEQKLYNSLKCQIWGQNIRLEQERICWDTAWNIIEGAY